MTGLLNYATEALTGRAYGTGLLRGLDYGTEALTGRASLRDLVAGQARQTSLFTRLSTMVRRRLRDEPHHGTLNYRAKTRLRDEPPPGLGILCNKMYHTSLLASRF